jgi:hypothetical protein
MKYISGKGIAKDRIDAVLIALNLSLLIVIVFFGK